jgi:hypothetical protein
MVNREWHENGKPKTRVFLCAVLVSFFRGVLLKKQYLLALLEMPKMI